MPCIVRQINIYPLKGAGGAEVQTAEITERGLAGDRRFALALAKNSLQAHAEDAHWRPWNHFHSLKKFAQLVKISAQFKDGKLHLNFGDNYYWLAPDSPPAVREKLCKALRIFLCAPVAAIADSEARPLWDEDAMPVTLINAASADALAAEPERFRANIVFAGVPAWAEENWRGAARIGTARLQLAGGVPRCAATTVNPRTARRDLRIPAILATRRRHNEMGLFAKVLRGGKISVGDKIRFEPL